MTRTKLIEATSVNALVARLAAVHDPRLVQPRHRARTDNPWQVPLADGDDWPDDPMRIMRTMDDPTATRVAGRPAADVRQHRAPTGGTPRRSTAQTPEYQQFVRAGPGRQAARSSRTGRCRCRPGKTDGNPPAGPGSGSGWRCCRRCSCCEHNAVCDMLRGDYPAWTDEEIFQRARLIVAALIAKIHTVEWTPAIIGHPTTAIGDARQLVRPRRGAHATTCSAGSAAARSSAASRARRPSTTACRTRSPRSSCAVYRMHPLMPDDWSSARRRTTATLGDCDAARPRRPGGIDGARQDGSMPTCSTPSAPRTPALVTPAQLPAVPAGVRAARTAS